MSRKTSYDSFTEWEVESGVGAYLVMLMTSAKFAIGQIVQHKIHKFRGVIFDIDAEFANTDEWWERIPEEQRPAKEQPFYHLFAENDTSYYIAYVSEQNLVPDETGEPVDHPDVEEVFGAMDGDQYQIGAELH